MANKSLLVFHQGALGDLILTFPVLRILIKKFTKIDLICQSKLGPLAIKLGIADKTYSVESALISSFFNDTLTTRAETFLKKYPNHLFFSVSTQLDQTFVGLSGLEYVRIPPRPEHTRKIHVTQYLFEELVRIGLVNEEDAQNWMINKSEKIESIPQAIATKMVALHPGSGSLLKNWPIDHFMDLAGSLKVCGFEPEFILGPAEEMLDEKNIQPYAVKRFDDLIALVEYKGWATLL